MFHAIQVVDMTVEASGQVISSSTTIQVERTYINLGKSVIPFIQSSKRKGNKTVFNAQSPMMVILG